MPNGFTWEDLDFWQSEEWLSVQNKLDALDQAGVEYCPDRDLLFRALDETQYSSVRVVLLGQDPFPSGVSATGLAFSLESGTPSEHWPRSLIQIFREYQSDLGLPLPSSGSLLHWAKQGVLLWNTVPSVLAGLPLSHWYGMPEWRKLTRDILGSLNDQGIVVCALGGKARAMLNVVDFNRAEVIEVSHPSPRAVGFIGSRIFSTINSKLHTLGREPIDWRLA